MEGEEQHRPESHPERQESCGGNKKLNLNGAIQEVGSKIGNLIWGQIKKVIK